MNQIPVKKTAERVAPAIQHVTQGTYQREIVDSNALTFVAGTEYEVAVLASNVLADTADKDELFSWVRGMFFVFDTGTYCAFEWMVYKTLIADADVDMNASAAMEALHKDSKLFGRGILLQPDPDSGGPVRPVKFEFFNVKLRYGEELRLLLRPIAASGGATGHVHGVIEWRQVGV